MLSIGPVPNWKDYSKERLNKLLLINDIRGMELLESLQYGVLYSICAFFAGVSIDWVFPDFNEETKTQTLALEVILQSLAVIVVVFYMRKLIKVVPFLFVFHWAGASKYRPYESSEYSGEVILSLIFFATQFNLIKKLDLLSRRFYKVLFEEEKKIGHSLGL
jgi:hypothetical protein